MGGDGETGSTGEEYDARIEAFMGSFVHSLSPGPRQELPEIEGPSYNEIDVQEKLQLLVEETSVNWTYGIHWKITSFTAEKGLMLGWGDGYFKGPKDSEVKAVNQVESVSNGEDDQKLRLKVLRELQALVGADEDENLTAVDYVSDAEWFYLVSMSCFFANGQGTPGRALATRKYVWLTEVNKVASHVCTRADLAKVAGIQTILCVPTRTGVLELGSTELIPEGRNIVENVKTLFFKSDENIGTSK